MRTELQGTVIAILEECLAVDTEEFFRTLDGDPSLVFCHGLNRAFTYLQ
jgi:hypothetical protein